MNSILKALFSAKQLRAWSRVPTVLASIFSGTLSLKHLLLSIIFVLEAPILLITDNIPLVPAGQVLDLSEYSLVFCDDFDGDKLDTDVWDYRETGSRRGGFNSPEQVKVQGGDMTITGEYKDGEFGEGWYGGMIRLKQKYTRGYFEIRCICNKYAYSGSRGFWSAFWLMSDNPYDPEISKGGIGGAEIDIMEAFDYDTWYRKNAVMSTVHCAGMQGDESGGLNTESIGRYLGFDIYNRYNTYGCEWTEDEYIFYINGIETDRSTWADGVSTVPEEVIVSLENPEKCEQDKDLKAEYIVDYVKIYQKDADIK